MRLILAILVLLGFSAPAMAGSDLGPDIPKATGEPHPEGNEFWRKNHMVLLSHDRDLTLREGEREDIQASLQTCFDCHTVKDEAGQPVPIEDERNFCRVCHDFVAVKPDCFTCHRSTPSDNVANRLMATPDEPSSIAAYLARLKALEEQQAQETEAGQ